ncbi:MAG: hypothetical protein IIW05_01160 [Paludibacteraceae bacterium]|nr:hypothetical protein [Paludibacteraceae bacterium]
MNEENNRNGARKVVNLILVVTLLVLLALMGNKFGLFGSSDDAETKQTPTETTTVEQSFEVSQQEWNALKNEVNSLRKEVDELKRRASQASSQTASSKSASAQSSSSKAVSAITMAKYVHDWGDRDASVNFKNHLDKTITSITGRMVYYDMKGEMLDYQDFTTTIMIAPKMVKTVSLKGYGYNENYAYYRHSSVLYDERAYKVKFELISYKTKE